MHRIAHVMQQLANDLSLIFLLHPIQDGGIRGRAGGRCGRFQMFSPFLDPGGTIGRLGEFRSSLKKLPAVPGLPGRPQRQA